MTAGRNSYRSVFIILALCAVLLPGRISRGQNSASISIVNSPHNLSAAGPGTVKAAGESQVCIFCHTPHNSTPVKPLWNRAMPVNSYKTYTSSSLKAQPGQPTGSSKLCLSCHDGTIALGSVNSRGQPIQMAGGITTLPPGASNLGTDLSDDHPISFVYDSRLVTKNPKLKDPRSLPASVRLDGDRNLQCTSCHDAHDNRYGNFLVMSNQNSELCNSCHTMSTGGAATDIAQHTACNDCHKTHTAPSGPYLLTRVNVSESCLACHNGVPANGVVQGPNVAIAVNSAFPHDTSASASLSSRTPVRQAVRTGSTPRDPRTTIASPSDPSAHSADCKDCHESHTMKVAHGTVPAPGISPAMGAVSSITIGGATTAVAQFDYEVCFKCHSEDPAVNPRISRKIVQPNIRLKVAPSAVSFHPVAARGKNLDVPSLRPPYTTDSIISCMDCHGSDTSKKAGGSGANGPHGSSFPGILLARYETADFTAYTTTAYDLCFRCHDNTKVVANSGPFPLHKKHIADEQTPCSVCHDSHGIPATQGNNLHNFGLINFDTSVVLPDDVTHSIDFTHTGPDHGTCTLKCHGKQHNAASY